MVIRPAFVFTRVPLPFAMHDPQYRAPRDVFLMLYSIGDKSFDKSAFLDFKLDSDKYDL